MYEEQFCEIILNLDQWFWRNCRSKAFLIWISGSPFVQHSVTICANLLEGIKRNNSVNYFEFGSVVQEQMLLKDFLSGALATLLFGGAEPFIQF